MHADKPLHDGDDTGDKRSLVPAAIGEPGIVGHVDILGVGARPDDLAEDGEASETGIEQENDGRTHGWGYPPVMDRSGQEIEPHGVRRRDHRRPEDAIRVKVR